MKQQPSFFARHWKVIINIVTLLALAVLIYAIRHQLAETIRNLRHVNIWFLLLMIPIEFLGYHSQARLYQRLFGIVGNKLRYGFLFRASLELNFINHVFPSGGVTGFSYFSVRMKDGEKITASKASIVQIMRLVLVFLSFELLLVVGLIALAVGGKASNVTMLVTGSLATLLVLATMAFSYIVGSRHRITVFFTGATKLLNNAIHLIRRNEPETINIARARVAFDDAHQNYQLFRHHIKELRWPIVYALVINVTELAALYTVYLAFGEPVNIGAVILAYAIANFAGVVSVLPGGVGIYEGLMTGVLVAGGVPASTSLPVTVMYRVLSTAIQIPPGYFLYHGALRAVDKRRLKEGQAT